MKIFKFFKCKAKIFGDRVIQPAPNAANWIFKKCIGNCIIENIQLMLCKLKGKP